MPCDWSLIAPVVTYARVASPVIRLQMLAPLLESRAFAIGQAPDDLRGVVRVARDHQLLAVALVPAEGRDAVVRAVEDPAWLAEVIDGRIASHRESLWLPSRIQPPSC
jgi:hypothetical protein